MPRSLKKGPFVDGHLMKKVDSAVANSDRPRAQDLVAPLDHPARNGGADLCGA